MRAVPCEVSRGNEERCSRTLHGSISVRRAARAHSLGQKQQRAFQAERMCTAGVAMSVGLARVVGFAWVRSLRKGLWEVSPERWEWAAS